jgi:hypothetical protein
MKANPKKTVRKTPAPQGKKSKKAAPLEEMYREYIVPMAHERWSAVTNLSQPSMLKRVPCKTAYSSVG